MRLLITALALSSVLATTVASADASPSVALPAGFAHRTVTANGQQLHVVIGGKGDPIVLIHGWPETWYEWNAVMPLLAATHTVIVPDLRGLGDSARAKTGFDKKTLAEDIYQLVHGLGFEKVMLVGHDWGAPVAYAYAANHRDAVTKLVMIEGAPFGPWTKERAPYWFFGFQSIPDFAERVLAGHEREYLMWFYKNPDFGVLGDTAIEEYARTYASPAGIKAGAELYRAIGQDIADNKDAQKHPLEIPVLAIGAEHGNGAVVGTTMKLLAKHVTAIVIPKAAHFLPELQPELVANKILAF
ncbi:MAG TPA: alpha/beta hydrolase [Kofleriaceae bacterium]